MSASDFVNHRAHLIQLVGTDIRAISESKIDQAPFPQELLFCELFTSVSDQRERPADMCSTYLLRDCSLSLCLLDALFLLLEVIKEPRPCQNEDCGGLGSEDTNCLPVSYLFRCPLGSSGVSSPSERNRIKLFINK